MELNEPKLQIYLKSLILISVPICKKKRKIEYFWHQSLLDIE